MKTEITTDGRAGQWSAEAAGAPPDRSSMPEEEKFEKGWTEEANIVSVRVKQGAQRES